MNNKRSRRPRRPNHAEQARKLRNNAAMHRVYEAALRQRESAPMPVCGGYNCACNDFQPCLDSQCSCGDAA